MKILNEQLDGSLLAARYAFMPNKLRYCGGDSNSELFEYAAHQAADDGLKAMLKEFEAMYPYLRLIAEANKIADPFNYKVVEAYWIGNELLENVSMNNFYRYLVDEHKLKKKLKPAMYEKIFGKIPAGAKPHHNFHVLNIPKRTGNYPVEHTLSTMNDCIITSAKIKRLHVQPCDNKKNRSECNLLRKIVVEHQPLIAVGNDLAFGETAEKEVFCEFKNKAFIDQPKTGDWVAIHWGWVCDRLNQSQVENLNKWTRYNLVLANL